MTIDKSDLFYKSAMIDDCYTVLTTRKKFWPSYITLHNRIDFIDSMIEHYTKLDQYEKCKNLVIISNELKNKIK